MIRLTNKKEMYQPIVDLGDRVKVAFDYEVFYDEDEEGNKIPSNVGTWTEAIIKPKPSLEQIKSFILNAINKRTDEKILSGFVWNDNQVWLSSENQFNYKAVYDVAVQTNGANLPLTFKFGDSENPIYYKFEELEDLQDFYLKALEHINEQLVIGWKKKDSIDWSTYKDALNNLK
jgi:hypothetical protein